MTRYEVLAQNFRRAAVSVVLALLIVIAGNCFAVSNHERSLGVSFTLWALASLPLLIFLPGMRRGLISSFAWLSYVSMLYFLYGVLAVFSPSRHTLDVLLLSLSVLLFLSAMLSVRYSARAQRETIVAAASAHE